MGQKTMFVAIWQTVIEHALMKRQISPPSSILKECWQNLPQRESGERFDNTDFIHAVRKWARD